MKTILKLMILAIFFNLTLINIAFAEGEGSETKEKKSNKETKNGILVSPAEIEIVENIPLNREIELQDMTITNTGDFNYEIFIEPQGNVFTEETKFELKSSEKKNTKMKLKVPSNYKKRGSIKDEILVRAIGKETSEELRVKVLINYKVDEKLTAETGKYPWSKLFKDVKKFINENETGFLYVLIGILSLIILLLVFKKKKVVEKVDSNKDEDNKS